MGRRFKPPVGHIPALPHLSHKSLMSHPCVTMSMLTLNPITLYYWDFIMIYHGPKQLISSWASEVHPGAPLSRCSSTRKTLTTTKTCPSSHSGTRPPTSTAPSSNVDSVLTKSLSISKPTPAQGLYQKPLKTGNKHVPASSTLERIDDEDSDTEMIEGGSDVNLGPIKLVDKNQSTNIEFHCTQDTPSKLKQLKRKLKVCV